jgi:hypothetical protein
MVRPIAGLSFPSPFNYDVHMSGETQDLIQIVEQLPHSKRGEVADFARFLLARQDDERWERLLDSPEKRPKLEAFLRESAAEAETPLDPERL